MTPADSSEPAVPRRPRAICHMPASVDGRIATGGWPLTPETRQDELVHASYAADAWICAMLRDGLVDEVGLLVAPVADRAVGTASLFDVVDGGGPAHASGHRDRRLALDAVERRADDVLWLRDRVVSEVESR